MDRPEIGYQLKKDTSTGLHILDGTFEGFVESLNHQQNTEVRESPTTGKIPKKFIFYNIMQVSTGSNYQFKLEQVEKQIQYIVARGDYEKV